jgi:urease accessory protein
MCMPMAPATSMIIRMITNILRPPFRPHLQLASQRAKSKAGAKGCKSGKKLSFNILEKPMKLLSSQLFRSGGVAALALIAGVAQAHTGHGTSGITEGMVHPFGLDHLLAMVAVGVWSVSALPSSKAWWGPATFMIALVLSAAMGTAGITVPYLEGLISLSVVLFGVMLIASRTQWPVSVGLVLIATAASLHGLAHGAEAPDSGFTAYAIGFLLTTAALHLGGVAAGLSIRRHFSRQAPWIIKVLGFGCGGAGLYLLSQV